MKNIGIGMLAVMVLAATGCTSASRSENRQAGHHHRTTVILKPAATESENAKASTTDNSSSTRAKRPSPTKKPTVQKKTDPYAELSKSLAKAVKGDVAPVTVGNFVFEGSDQVSAFSAMLRKELELALPKTGRFRIATRERLAELLEEDGLHDAGILDPDNRVERMKLKGVEAIVRGSFHYEYPRVTVYAQLAWLNGAEASGAKVVIDARDIHTGIVPATSQMLANPQQTTDSIVKPQNMAEGLNNVKDVRDRIKKIPHDFGLFLTVSGNKRGFVEGETISYTVTAEEDCHIAAFCHQVNDETIVLFPNQWCTDSRVQAGRKTRMPGAEKDGFVIEVGEPFGADVIQVIACTKRSELHRMLEKHAQTKTDDITYRGITRGQFAQGIANSLSGFSASSLEAQGPSRWGEAHVVISSYPRFAR